MVFVLLVPPAVHRAQYRVRKKDVYDIIRFTRNWIHYGFISHMAVCITVAAIKGVTGR